MEDDVKKKYGRQTKKKIKDDLNFLTLEDELNFLKMEDSLIFILIEDTPMVLKKLVAVSQNFIPRYPVLISST